MNRMGLLVIMIILSGFFAGLSFGEEPVIFPAKGQTPEQTEKDKYDCYTWAKQQTCFDPMQAPPTQTQAPKGERIKGAAISG